MHTILLSFVLPVLAVIIVLAINVNAPVILILYAVIVSEGIVLFHWILTKLMADRRTVPGGEIPSPSFFLDKNKAEMLFDQVKSARKRSGEYGRYSRVEISKVLRGIVDGDSKRSPELEFLLNPPSKRKDANRFDYLSSLDSVVSELESE